MSASRDTDNRRQRRDMSRNSDDIKLSKSLTYICRHGAEKEGLRVYPGGFVFVDEILQLRQFHRYSVADIERVVTNNDKQRFALMNDQDTSKLQIRANQGHTLKVDGLELTPLSQASDAPVVVHGTYFEAWKEIQKEGLSRMKRNHIHFAPGEPGDDAVISGMRSSCEVLVFINLEKALKDGYEFYRSANNVILCPGNEKGYLPTQYFDRVLQARPRRQLPFTTNEQS